METRRRASRPRVSPFFTVVVPGEGDVQEKLESETQTGSRALQPASQPGDPPATGRQVREMHFHGVYVISVASRLLEMHPQTLRKYERFGLVSPSRTEGMLRLYSESDIARLRMIKYLVETGGLNLAGVEMALRLVDGLLKVRRSVKELDRKVAARQSVEQELDALLDLLHFATSSEPEA
jgi:MerR family transcriptional regulator/heat shock protein HspR